MSDTRPGHLKDGLKCSCKGHSLDKFLQPNILILLAMEDLHGYSIIQELEDKKLFYGQQIDSAGIYRTLNLLENRGLVVSEWDLAGAGAAKKIYSITEAGLECLRNWIITLEQYKETLESTIERAKEVLKQPN
ncbi:MAG: PadR family transcriptional regulator [Clostridia bacterium]|nr:PadR family transcriptional regulator [Clostridia bacterium]